MNVALQFVALNEMFIYLLYVNYKESVICLELQMHVYQACSVIEGMNPLNGKFICEELLLIGC